mgnify:CR=1 FL=1
MQVIGGAIKRINNPDDLVFADHSTFLAQNGVLRIGLMNRLNDFAFRASINQSDKIVPTFAFHLQLRNTIQIAHDVISRTARSRHGNIN